MFIISEEYVEREAILSLEDNRKTIVWARLSAEE